MKKMVILSLYGNSIFDSLHGMCVLGFANANRTLARQTKLCNPGTRSAKKNLRFFFSKIMELIINVNPNPLNLSPGFNPLKLNPGNVMATPRFQREAGTKKCLALRFFFLDNDLSGDECWSAPLYVQVRSGQVRSV